MKRRLISALVMSAALLAASGCSNSNGEMNVPGVDLAQEISGVISQATGSLGSIVDLDSALSALPDLKGLDASLGNLMGQASQLSPEGQQNVTDAVNRVAPSMQMEAQRVLGLPEVSGTGIQSTIESMMGKITKFM